MRASSPTITRTPSRRIGVAVLLAALTFALLPAGVAAAHEKQIDDPRDGEAGHPDIESAAHAHGDGNRMRHTIVTYGDADVPPCLMLHTRFPVDQQLRICGDGAVIRPKDDEVIGTAVVERPDLQTVSYVIRPDDIGGAKSYEWFAFVRSNDCADHRCDRAPDAGWVVHAPVISYEAWADGLLTQLDAPTCKNNRIAVVAWLANEGTQARYNPLATTYELPGSTDYNSSGVQNYASLSQGNKATRLTLERGWTSYGYKPIVLRLRACAIPKRTARAIRGSQWCSGCSGGQYVSWLIQPVRDSYNTYAERLISTL